MQGRKFAVQLLDQTEQAGSYSNLLLDHALHQVEMEQKSLHRFILWRTDSPDYTGCDFKEV